MTILTEENPAIIEDLPGDTDNDNGDDTEDLADPRLTGPEVLLMAADVVMERRLTRGKLEDSQGRVCALGALGVAAAGDAFHDNTDENPRGTTPAFKEAQRILHAYVKDHGLGSTVIDWNDECVTSIPFTKHAERHVATVMRKAAREACS